MKRVVAAAALISTIGTMGFACSSEDVIAASKSISDVTRELVELDSANLGEVQKIMMAAAVEEYHDDTSDAVCARQRSVLDALTDFSATLNEKDSAQLKDDLL